MYVAPKSSAAAAGVATGDTVTAVAGRPVDAAGGRHVSATASAVDLLLLRSAACPPGLPVVQLTVSMPTGTPPGAHLLTPVLVATRTRHAPWGHSTAATSPRASVLQPPRCGLHSPQQCWPLSVQQRGTESAIKLQKQRGELIAFSFMLISGYLEDTQVGPGEHDGNHITT